MKRFYLIFFLVPFSCIAQEKLHVLTESWVPFNYTHDDKIVGVSTELVEKTLRHAGFEYELQVLPWTRAYKKTLKDDNVFLFSTNRTKQRESLFQWIGPLIEQDVSFYRLKSRGDIIVNQLDDLKNYSVGVARGGSIEGYLVENGFIENKDYFTYTDEAQGEKMLKSGRIELIPGGIITMAYRASSLSKSNITLEKAFTFLNTRYYIATNKETSEKVVAKLQSSLDHLVAQGVRDDILSRYLQTSP